ncbi:hypothetical protein MMC25_007842 [Agyrium rufum]|nr:hypothetical protein [Agyrium rufum]
MILITLLGFTFLLLTLDAVQAKHENYVVHTLQADRVVLAPKYLEELRMLPEDKLNSAAALVDRTLGVYNGVDIILDGHLSSNVSRVQLTKNLPNLIPVMAEELEYALGRDLCEGSLKGAVFRRAVRR